MLNVGKIETKDLSRKDFDSWFAGMLLKYDNFELSKDTDIKLLTATLQTISANTQEVLSMNWNKMHDEKGNCDEISFSIFSTIKWTDTQLLRLVVDPSLATEILKKQATGSRRFDYPQEVQLKLEGTILGVEIADTEDTGLPAIDYLLSYGKRATDLEAYIEQHLDKAPRIAVRSICPIGLLRHAYTVGKDKANMQLLFSLLKNKNNNPELRGMRMDIINTYNYDLLLDCCSRQDKETYYKTISQCAEMHGLSLKVEEN